jgi:hypothetical protein
MIARGTHIGAIALLIVLPTVVEAAEPATGAAASLDEFEILQYISAREYSPSVSIALDNNSRILLACRSGRSADQLRQADIEFVDSQIEFLIATNLLVRDSEGSLFTTFPILEEPQVRALRKETASLAEELSEVARGDVEALAHELELAGLADHAYPLMFSYVLDGMVWGFFEEYRRVVPRKLSVGRPFWSGEVWAMRPGREFTLGTHSIEKSGLKLKASMSAVSAAETRRLFADSKALRSALEQYAKQGYVEEGRQRQLLAEFGLIDVEGHWTIPVIDEIEKGPVFRAAETVTSNLVDAIFERIDLKGMQERYGFRSASQTLVVVYHELMWDLMERFEGAGLIERPVILTQPSTVKGSGIADVAFLVDRRPPKPDRQDALEPRVDALEESETRPDGA